MKRILLITSVLPWPLRHNGGAQRTALLRDALALHGEVDIAAIGGPMLREETPDFDAKMAAANVVSCVIRRGGPSPRKWYLPGPLGSLPATVQKYLSNYEPDAQAVAQLNELMRSRPYDLFVSRYLQPALQYGVNHFPNVPTILDFDDIDWLTLATQISAKPWGGVTGRLASKRVLSRVTQVGQRALQTFDKVLVTSEEDAALLPCRASVLPNIPFTDRQDGWIDPLPPATNERLLFVGDLQFPPNREGLDRFLTGIWPAVKSARPAGTLSIVGRGLSDSARAKWSQSPGVDVVGFAADLVAHYRDSAMTVVPLYFGGGTKIKVLESLAYGRAVVTTPQSMRGYDGLNGVAVSADDATFAVNVIRLLQNPAERDALARAGREDVERRFSPQRFRQIVDETLSAVFTKVRDRCA